MNAIAGPIVGFLSLLVLFWVLETLWPDDRSQPRWRRDSPTDVLYFFLDHGSRFVGTVVALIAIWLATRLLPATGLPWVRGQPLWLQGLEMLLLGDLCGYWMHRTFHERRRLWPIHAVHHSSEAVDWLSSARVHPLNTVADRVAVVLPLFLLGFSGAGLGPYAVFLAIYPIYLHANVRWDYGPLKYLIASPAFHRWHHSSEPAALDKNYAGLLPLWDLLFGTAYFPARHVARFGLYGERMPRGIVRQLLYPFRAKRG